METRYLTVKIKPDKPQQRPDKPQERTERRGTFYRDCTFYWDCAVFGACGIGIYIVTCAVLILGRLA